MIKRFLSALVLLAGFLMSACSAPPTERSVQVFDKDGKPVPYAIICQEYYLSKYPPNIAVADKNGYYSFKNPDPKEYEDMYYSTYDKDGRFFTPLVTENGLNLNTSKVRCNGILVPPPPNQFDKNTNPNFKLYCTRNLLYEKDKYIRYDRADSNLRIITHPQKKILNQEDIIKKYITLLEKIKKQNKE